MPDINEWWLQGRIGAISPLQSGAETSYCKVSLATSTRHDNEGKPTDEWHDLLLFRRLAEKFHTHAQIGQTVRFKGYLHRYQRKHPARTTEQQLIVTWFAFDTTKRSETDPAG